MQKEDIRLRQVIIHIMDSTMGMPVLSDQVIDFGSDFGDFLRAHIFRLLESDDHSCGTNLMGAVFLVHVVCMLQLRENF